MHRLFARSIRRLLCDERAATSIEYAMIASGISIAIVAGVTTLGDGVKTTLYDKLATLF